MDNKLDEEEKKSAKLFTAGILAFAIIGVLIAVVFHPPGIAVLGPLLIGPGITIFFFGALYSCSLGPLLGFENEELTDKIRYSYMGIGALFAVMGLFAWFLG